MAEVTDVVFREFVARKGKPDVFFTEFVSAAGLVSEKGREALMQDVFFTEAQRPIVAQIFGGVPEEMAMATKILRELGVDGIDINMGCPDKKVEKQGAGASLIRDPERAKAIIAAVFSESGDVSVSVKTRIGYTTIHTETWARELCSTGIDALTMHLRTRKELSLVPAHWEEAAIAARVARDYGVVFIANGDVENREDGVRLSEESGAHGIMIGRGVYGNPYVFAPNGNAPQTMEEKKRALAELVVMFRDFWGNSKHYEILKRFFASYIRGFVGAKALRMRLMETQCAEEALIILEQDPQPLPIVLSKVFREKTV
jgi:nifR3 family TIM-barrel protein